MGCGVGTVVCQAAAEAHARAIGFEIMCDHISATTIRTSSVRPLRVTTPPLLRPGPAEFGREILKTFTEEMTAQGCALKHEPKLLEKSFTQRDKAGEHYLTAKKELGEADVIFTNNFAFSVELSCELGRRIAEECKIGTRILSFKPLAFGRTRAAGIESRSGLREVRRGKYADGVSWTTAEVEYILYERV